MSWIYLSRRRQIRQKKGSFDYPFLRAPGMARKRKQFSFGGGLAGDLEVKVL